MPITIPPIIVGIGLALTAWGTLWAVRDFSAATRLLAQQDALIASQDAQLADARTSAARVKQENVLMAKFVRGVVERQRAEEMAP